MLWTKVASALKGLNKAAVNGKWNRNNKEKPSTNSKSLVTLSHALTLILTSYHWRCLFVRDFCDSVVSF